MPAVSDTPVRATRSTVKAARERGDADGLLCGLTSATRKPKTSAPKDIGREPLVDVANNSVVSSSLEVHPDMCKAPPATSPPLPAGILQFRPSSQESHQPLDAGSDQHLSSDLLTTERLLKTETQDSEPESDEESCVTAEPLLPLGSDTFTREEDKILNGLSPGRWETDDAASPMAVSNSEGVISLVKSKVVVPGSFEPRSLRQLKKDCKQLSASADVQTKRSALGLIKQSIDVPADTIPDSGNLLAAALDDLCIQGPYEEDGNEANLKLQPGENNGYQSAIISNDKTILRGVPQPTGRHIRFD